MPLPAATAERKLLHTRTITCQGYERVDGLYDIDGWMTDIKTYSFPNHDRGEVKAGEPLHGMGLRITFDPDTYTIQDIVAVTDFAPMTVCAAVTPNFARLKGLRFVSGFNRKARELLGGVQGCTHLLDLLGPMATTAFQTIAGKRLGQRDAASRPRGKHPLIDTCHGWSAAGPLVQREFPDHYTGGAIDPPAR